MTDGGRLRKKRIVRRHMLRRLRGHRGFRYRLGYRAVGYGTEMRSEVDGRMFWGTLRWRGKWVVPSCYMHCRPRSFSMREVSLRCSVVLPGQRDHGIDIRTSRSAPLTVASSPAAVHPPEGGPIFGRGRVPAGRSAAVRMVGPVSFCPKLLVVSGFGTTLSERGAVIVQQKVGSPSF
jgi:hypothetical protein